MSAAMMPTPPDSPRMDHSGGFAMQKYFLLAEQHEELRANLESIRASAYYPSMSTTASSNSYASTPAVSPTRGSCSPFGAYPPSSSSSSRHHSRRSSLAGPPKTRRNSTALTTLADESILFQLAEEEQRMFDVNEAMKRALTELLNGDQARSDRTFRNWVQCRLMETEKELRSERRRKSSP